MMFKTLETKILLSHSEPINKQTDRKVSGFTNDLFVDSLH